MRSLGPIATTATGVRLRLRIQPRASQEGISGVAGDAIRLRFLAARLEVPRSAVELVSGRSGRTKLVAVTGVSVEEAARRLGVERG